MNTSVGKYETLAERWNGETWAQVPIPTPDHSDESGLEGLACPRASACLAVGHTTIAHKALTERWAGGMWQLLATPAPVDSARAWLTGVACRRVSRCVAVGWSLFNNQGRGLMAEHWDGAKWTIEEVPSPVTQ